MARLPGLTAAIASIIVVGLFAPGVVAAEREDVARLEALLDEGRAFDAARGAGALIAEAAAPSAALFSIAARAHFRLEQFGEARVFAEAARLRDAGARDAWPAYLLAEIARRAERWERAVALYEEAATIGVDHGQLLTAAASKIRQARLLRDVDARRAAEAFASASGLVARVDAADLETLIDETDVSAAKLQRARVELLLAIGETAAAAEAAHAIYVAAPDDPEVAHIFVAALLAAERYAEAFNAAASWLESVEGDRFISTFVRSGVASGQLARWLDAQSVTPVLLLVTEALEQRGHWSAAVVGRSKAYAAAPDRAEAAWHYAVALRRSGDSAAAVDVLDAFYAHQPTADIPVEAFLAFVEAPGDGVATGSTGRYQTAWVRALASAMHGDRGLATPRFVAAADAGFVPAAVVAPVLLAIADEAWDEARMLAEEAVESHAALPALHYALGVACIGTADRTCAESSLREAVDLDPNEPTYGQRLGLYYTRSGDLSAAQRYLQQASAKAPARGRLLEFTIESYLAAGKVGVARRQFERALVAGLTPYDARRRIRTTLEHVDALNGDAHLAALRSQHAEHPHDLQTQTKLIALLSARSYVDEALETARRAFATAPRDNDVATLYAQAASAALAQDEAIAALQSLQKRYPRRVDVSLSLAAALGHDFRFEAQRDLLRALLTRADLAVSDRAAARAVLFESLVYTGDYEEALALIEQWASEDEAPLAFAPQRLRLLVQQERSAEAAAWATTLYTDEPDDARRRLLLYEALLSAERYERLEAYLEAWRASEPREFRWTQALIELLLLADRAKDALDVIAGYEQQSVRSEVILRSQQAEAEAALGDVDRAVDRLDRLLGDLRRAGAGAELQDVRRRLLITLLDADRIEAATARVAGWVSELQPEASVEDRIALLQMKLFIQQQDGDMEAVEATLQRLVAIAPTEPGFNNDLAYTWVDQNQRVDEALEMLRRAVAAEPLNAAYLDSLGWAHYKRGDFAESLRWLRRAAQLADGRDPVVFDHLGDAAWRTGDIAAAETAWEEARTLAATQDEATMGMESVSEVLAAVEAKLAALRRGAAPRVAKTAAEANVSAMNGDAR